MYAKLGDIVFENLVGFEAMSDKRATNYAQQPVIDGKPRLDRTGEELTQFTITFNLHIAFCNPEDEYAKLNNARIAGTVLPFIYGNGFIEGDFVISTIERTFNKTDKIGNLEWITVTVTLLEFVSGNTAAAQQERDKSNAFAISTNRPLPSNPNTQPDNPALDVMNANKDGKQATSKFDQLTKKIKQTSDIATSSPPISTAQAFVDEIPNFVQKNNEQLTKANVAMSQINTLVTQHTNITTESPGIPAAITGGQNATAALSAMNTTLGTVPATITSVPMATAALGVLANLLTLKDNFVKAMADLNNAMSAIARAIALKKDLT